MTSDQQLTLLEVPVPVEVDGENERYTIRSTDAWCRKTLGVEAWDLDVAACTEAHLAENYYTKANDGLRQPWRAPRVWCNPPFDDLEAWLKKAFEEFREGRFEVLGFLMPANRTEQPFWHDLLEPVRDRGLGLTSHFLPGRTVYGHPGNREGVGVGSPPFSSVLFGFREPSPLHPPKGEAP